MHHDEKAHPYIDLLANLLELGGVFIIVVGIVLFSGVFISQGARADGWLARIMQSELAGVA